MPICIYCSFVSPITQYFEVDHDLPQSKFPTLRNVSANLNYACVRCNRQKGDKTGVQYKVWRMLNPTQANITRFM